MKRILLIFFIGIFPVLASAQDVIPGKWKFKEVYNTEKFDSMGMRMAKQMFGNMTVYLKPDKRYSNNFFVKEEGTWDYDSSSKQLTMMADKGTIAHWDFELLSKETILVSFAMNKSIVMQRVPLDAGDETKSDGPKQILVSVTPSAFCHKWVLKARHVPGKTTEETKIVTDIFEGAFFYFHPDKSFDAKIGQISDGGTWEFTNNNQTVILTANKEMKYWNVKSISATELSLYRGRTEEFWTFSMQE
jgi:hypothetical protein